MPATSPLLASPPVQRRPGRMESTDIGEGQRPSLSEAPAYGRDDLTALHNTTDSDFQGFSIVKEEIKAEIMEEMKEGIEVEVKEETREEIDEDIESEGKEEVYSLEAELPFLPWTPDEDPLSVSALQSLVKEENLRCQLPSSSEDFFGFTEVDRDKTSKPIPNESEMLVYYEDDSARELTVHSETSGPSGESVTPSPAGPSSSAMSVSHADWSVPVTSARAEARFGPGGQSRPGLCQVYQWKLLHHVFKDHLVMLNPVHLSLQVHRLRLHQGRPELEFTPLMRDSKCATFVTEEICEQLRRRAAAEDSDSGVEVEVSDAKDGAAGGAPSASGGSALSKLNEETHAYCRGAAPPAGDRPETQAVHG
ncbi:hypothetical protein FJT64_023285 [Amphibalanus amphitrite]|nr:hypothetical protein FJT64_023285 [Amphibalanus amphitrite]